MIPTANKKDLKEAVTFAAVSGHTATVERLLEEHHIPDDIRDLAHEVAIAGGFHDIARLLKPTVH